MDKPSESGAGLKAELDDHATTATRYGVFYPKGHTVAVFRDADTAKSVAQEIEQAVGSEHLRLLDSIAMGELMQQSRTDAGIAAKIVGAELKQIAVFEQLAADGMSFVIFDQAQLGESGFERIVQSAKPVRVVHYGTLTMDNETPGGSGTPTGESPFGINERGR